MNNRLDRAECALLRVELILYHEMLHVKHPLRAAHADFRRILPNSL